MIFRILLGIAVLCVTQTLASPAASHGGLLVKTDGPTRAGGLVRGRVVSAQAGSGASAPAASAITQFPSPSLVAAVADSGPSHAAATAVSQAGLPLGGGGGVEVAATSGGVTQGSAVSSGSGSSAGSAFASSSADGGSSFTTSSVQTAANSADRLGAAVGAAAADSGAAQRVAGSAVSSSGASVVTSGDGVLQGAVIGGGDGGTAVVSSGPDAAVAALPPPSAAGAPVEVLFAAGECQRSRRCCSLTAPLGVCSCLRAGQRCFDIVLPPAVPTLAARVVPTAIGPGCPRCHYRCGTTCCRIYGCY